MCLLDLSPSVWWEGQFLIIVKYEFIDGVENFPEQEKDQMQKNLGIFLLFYQFQAFMSC